MQRVNVTIDGRSYTIIADDASGDPARSAALVDEALAETKASGRLAAVDAAVLAALNIADRYFKAQEAADNMRSQIKSYAEECASLRSEVQRLKKGLPGGES